MHKRTMFDDTETEKYKSYQHRSPFLIDNVYIYIYIYIYKIVVSNKVSFGKTILNILFAIKMQNKTDLYGYSFHKLLHTEDILITLLQKFNEILKKKVSKIIKKEFDSKPIYNV